MYQLSHDDLQRNPSRNHPRACGEQYEIGESILSTLGSSPRVRGAAVHADDRQCRVGIIPARTGSSVRSRSRLSLLRDHPRACGEQEISRTIANSNSPVFKESDPALVRALYHRAVAELEAFAPAAARVLEDAEVDALAHLSFPREHRIKIRTNNVQERMNCELKRRTKVVQAFPSTGSVMRLLGGIVDEINADWESGRLFMSKESLEPVLGLERAENRIGDFVPDEEVTRSAEVIMMVALDEFEKAA